MGVSGWHPGWYGKGHILISIYSMPYNANSVCNKNNYMGATSRLKIQNKCLTCSFVIVILTGDLCSEQYTRT